MAFEKRSRQMAMRRLVCAAVLIEKNQLHRTTQGPGLFEESSELDRSPCRQRQDPDGAIAVGGDRRANGLPRDRLACDHGARERVVLTDRVQEATEQPLASRLASEAQLHHPVVPRVPERLLVCTPVQWARHHDRHEHRGCVAARQSRRSSVEGCAHRMQGCRARVERAPPARARSLEELGLLVGPAQWIVRLRALELVHLEPNVFDEQPQISDRGAPFRRETPALFGVAREPAVDRGA